MNGVAWPPLALMALDVRAAQSGCPTSQLADPPFFIPSTFFNRLSLDLEGLALAPDGPYVFVFHYFTLITSD